MSSMNGLQREAMRRALRGEWGLADAIEVVSRTTDHPYDADLICGLREGGRLRYLAYGAPAAECSECAGNGTVETSDDCDEDPQCEMCGGTGTEEASTAWRDITLIVNLNGGVVYDAGTHDGLPAIADEAGISREAAQATIDEYHASLIKPTQVTLAIPEAA